MTEMFSSMKKRSFVSNVEADKKVEEDMEVRPGGMLVQKRDSNSISNISPSPLNLMNIRLKVKYCSSYNYIRISPQASFGDLKKILAVQTGLHPEEQKLIYKNKERDSKTFLDVSRVKDGSKIVLIEDTASKERRRLEKLKNANIEKASKTISRISLELDKLTPQVTVSEGRNLKQMDIDNLTGILMTKLVELDALIVDGELRTQKKMQERRAQQCIEILDKLKLQIRKPSKIGGKTSLIQQQEKSISQTPTPKEKKRVQFKQNVSTEKSQAASKQPSIYSKQFIVTTKWETFD
ncbi:hypothetical protein ACFE04_013057 [Oxalis oulophora]